MRLAIRASLLSAALALAAGPAPAASLDLDAATVGQAPVPVVPGDRDVAGTIWFQGFLADDATGDPVSAAYDVVAQMYSAESGGTSLWGPETHGATPIVEGWFNVELGKTVSLPSFSSPPYYLQLTVNGEVLAPRLKLASVPAAIRSGATDTAANDWATDGSNVYRLSGNVGIGDATPDGRLDVLSTTSGAAIIATATGSTAQGIDAMAFGTSGMFFGVRGEAQSTDASSCFGVYGHVSGVGSLYGVYGGASGAGSVYGVCGSVSGSGIAVYGSNAAGATWGALGADDAAVIGHAPSAATLAGRFDGRVSVDGGSETGTLDAALDVASHDYVAVRGYADRAAAGDTLTAGVYGETIADGGVGVYGKTSGFSQARNSYGVMGVATEPLSAGVYGTGPYQGVTGVNSVSHAEGTLGAGSTGVYGYSISGLAGEFSGDVYVSGRVGVGRTVPTAVLDVSDVVRIRGATWPAGNTGESMELAYNPTAHRGYIQVYDRDSGGGWGQLYLGDGNVGIGAATDYSHDLDVAGDIQCVALHQTSDDRLKTNVRGLEGVLDALEGIRGVSFEWNEEAVAAGATPGDRAIGVLAGEVQRAFPELVSSADGIGYKSVDYTKLTAVLIEAVKELRAENRALEMRVAELEGAGR